MNTPSTQNIRRLRCLLCLAVTSFSVILSGPAKAGFVRTSSSGTINYSVRDLGPATQGRAVFGPDGVLLSPGLGAPTIASTPRGAAQVFGPSPLSPALSGVADPSVIDDGLFGSASTTVLATGSGESLQAGVVVAPSTFIRASGASGVASVTIVQMSATFKNMGPTAVPTSLGFVLNLAATLGASAGTFVAAAITGTVTLHDSVPPGPTTYQLTPIVFSYDGSGPAGDYISASTASLIAPDGLSVTAAGIGIFPGSMPIAPGQSITVSSTLTLISDPESTIEIMSDLPPPLAGNVPLPDVGVYVGGLSIVVPEPPSFAMAAVAGVVALGDRARRRRVS